MASFSFTCINCKITIAYYILPWPVVRPKRWQKQSLQVQLEYIFFKCQNVHHFKLHVFDSPHQLEKFVNFGF
jgi:hypothetical protein